MQCRPCQREDKSEKISMQFLTRCALKQCINTYQIHFGAINAVLMTFEAKKSVNFISKSGCPNLNALKISIKYSQMTITASGLNIFISNQFIQYNTIVNHTNIRIRTEAKAYQVLLLYNILTKCIRQ